MRWKVLEVPPVFQSRALSRAISPGEAGGGVAGVGRFRGYQGIRSMLLDILSVMITQTLKTFLR